MTTSRANFATIETDERNGEKDKLPLEVAYTPAALKKLMGHRIIIASDEAEPVNYWATNSYFIASARRFMSIFEQYLDVENQHLLDPTQFDRVGDGASVHGVWDLTGKHPTLGTADPPNVQSFVGVKPTEGEVVRRLRINGNRQRAYTLTDAGGLLSVFEFADGRLVAFDDTYLNFILAGAVKVSYGERISVVQIRCIDHLKPAHIWALMEAKRGGHVDPKTPGKYVPESWVKDKPKLLGVLMPVRI